MEEQNNSNINQTATGVLNQESQEKKQPRKVFLIVIATFLFLIVIFVGVFLFQKYKSQTIEDVIDIDNPYGLSPAAQLKANNDVYQDARFARDIKDYDKAISLYEDALTNSSNSEVRAQIEYEIGVVQNYMNDPIGAIRRLKTVANNTDYSPLIRAYAIQQMGEVFYWRSDPATFDEIFKDDPYTNMFVPDKPSTSLKNLFEYASSFYPLAYAELKTAQFYANKILNVQTAGLTVSSEGLSIDEMKILIRQKVENAEKDIEDIKKLYPTDTRISSAIQRKAIIAGLIYRAGDPFLGDPRILFEQARQGELIRGNFNQAAFTTYHFASFLAQIGSIGNKEEVQALLEDFYEDGKFAKTTTFYDFLKNEGGAISTSRENILLLAEIDPKFKNLIISLGWHL